MIRPRLRTWGQSITEAMPCASQSVMLGSVRCWFANNSDVLTCLIKVVTAIKLRKVMGFLPFVMNNYSWGDPLGKNPVSHPTFHPRVFFFWLCWNFIAARTFPLAAGSGGCSPVAVLRLRSTGSGCSDFSSCGSWTQSCSSPALEPRLSSCGSRAQLLRGIWRLPRPGIEPVSPALAGGFFPTEPPRKPPSTSFNVCCFSLS